jgi:hypothetical protein
VPKTGGRPLFIGGRYPETIAYALKSASSKEDMTSNHLFHLHSFFCQLLTSYIYQPSPTTVDHKDATLILLDLPSIRVLLLINPSSFNKVILLEAECPYHSHRKLIQPTWLIVSPYQRGANILTSDTAYIYNHIPDYLPASDAINATEGSSDIAFIGSNLEGSSQMLYSFRRHIINIFSRIAPDSFQFYGRGWNKYPITTGNKLLRILHQSKWGFASKGAVSLQLLHDRLYRSGLPPVTLKCYKGELESKSILSNVGLTLSIENTIAVQGYTTEKPLEPLIYGSYPIVVANKSCFLASYIDIYEANVFSVVSAFQSLSSKPGYQLRNLSHSIKNAINSDIRNNSIRTNLKILSEILSLR